MDVIVSRISQKRRKIYHKKDCIYVKRMKPQNRRIVSQNQARNEDFRSCKYCSGLRAERRAGLFPSLEKQHNISINYVKNTDTLYIRTEIGFWKIFLKEELDKYLLYHRNTYYKDMPFRQAIHGDYHRQKDVKPDSSLCRLINYIAAHDRAKQIIMDDYRKLPRSTTLEKKYYRRAENKAKYMERRKRRIRLDDLFSSIEAKDPSMCKLAFC